MNARTRGGRACNREKLVKGYKLSARKSIRSEDIMYNMVTIVEDAERVERKHFHTNRKINKSVR